MKNIIVVSGSVEDKVSAIVKRVQTEIIDASAASRDILFDIIENSRGDFIDSLKNEVTEEVNAINVIGELLIEVAKYVQSAADAFTNVDTTFNISIMEKKIW